MKEGTGEKFTRCERSAKGLVGGNSSSEVLGKKLKEDARGG